MIRGADFKLLPRSTINKVLLIRIILNPEIILCKVHFLFSDGKNPDQIMTTHTDGLGRPRKIIRENDGVLLSESLYDHFFRTVGSYTIGQGYNTIIYDASPVIHTTTVTDAVGNSTHTEQSGSGAGHFALTKITDPNGHTSETYVDGLGRTIKTVSGEGSTTQYRYNTLNLLDTIINPIGEKYTYEYNSAKQIIRKKVPGADPTFTWYDVNYRPVAIEDGNENVQVF